MPQASTTLHEPPGALSAETVDIHRAIVSLMEELEAIDWYRQRAEAAADEHLRAILTHNMDEEIEHACMVLEWLRRHIPKLDEELRKLLFTEGDVTRFEEGHGGGGDVPERFAAGALRRPELTIGHMKGARDGK